VSFDTWTEGRVAPSEHLADVVAIKGPKPEAVSRRLKATLTHPSRGRELVAVRYSPDGKRILAVDTTGSVVQAWDAETGKELCKVNTGRQGAGDLFLSPDWQIVYSPYGKANYSKVERDGKILWRAECEGGVRAWDLASGALRETYQNTPPRYVLTMRLSPSGSRFVTTSELSGEGKKGPPQVTSFWDVPSKTCRDLYLPHGLVSVYEVQFSPDGARCALATWCDASHQSAAIKLFDAATARETLTIPISEQSVLPEMGGFTRDGKRLMVCVRVISQKEPRGLQEYFKFYDTATGEELASFPAAERDSGMHSPVESPDGSRLAAASWRTAHGKLHLFDLPRLALVHTITLAENQENEEIRVGKPAFSPDGRWVAVVTRAIPQTGRIRETPEEVPQPRIHLVDVAEGRVRETFIVPPGFSSCLCFSLDGKTLASGGHGKVLLWDVAELGAVPAPPGK
jgi:WD40 repeat protein